MSVIERTETQFAADIVWLLVVNGIVDRKRWSPVQLCETIGCSVDELNDARKRCTDLGYEALQPRGGSVTTPGSSPVRKPTPAPPPPITEKHCTKCGDEFPIDVFARLLGTGRRGSLCAICMEIAERDHYVAIRKAKALHQVIAYMTATRGDATVGMTCGKCGEPVRIGEPLMVQGEAHHVKCPKLRRSA